MCTDCQVALTTVYKAYVAKRFEHCKLEKTRIVYLGRACIVEDKQAESKDPCWAWDYLEHEGWELVTVVVEKGDPVAYFKRKVQTMV